MVFNTPLIQIFGLSIAGFTIAFLFTPILTRFLYRQKLGKQIRSDGSTPVFSQLHEKKRGTPTMGGVLIWGTVLVFTLFFWLSSQLQSGGVTLSSFNFLSRSQTWLPLGAFIGASFVGLLDDFLDARSLGYKGRGIRFRHKVFLYILVAGLGAWWFFNKLGINSFYLPGIGDIFLGYLYIPFFTLAVVGISFAVNLTDGLDGLAAGTLFVSFFAYALISYTRQDYQLTALIALVLGTLLAFLWFNIYPARFFMGDTGSMGLGVLLAILAFLTDTVYLLPFFGFVFLIEALSFFWQLAYRKVFKRKFFLSSPIHHHLEASGWPETKVTMRFWVLSWVSTIIGMIIFFLNH